MIELKTDLWLEWKEEHPLFWVKKKPKKDNGYLPKGTMFGNIYNVISNANINVLTIEVFISEENNDAEFGIDEFTNFLKDGTIGKVY